MNLRKILIVFAMCLSLQIVNGQDKIVAEFDNFRLASNSADHTS
jgi:hypothetical protein